MISQLKKTDSQDIIYPDSDGQPFFSYLEIQQQLEAA